MSNVEKLAEALECRMESDNLGDSIVTADGLRAALSAAGLELVEAGLLKAISDNIIELAERMPPPNAYTPQFITLAGAVRQLADRYARTAHALTEGEG